MLKAKKKSHSKLKRTAAIALTAITIVSGCVISASAAVQRATCKIELSSKDSTSFSFTAKNDGNQSDIFDSYMTIFNGQKYSKGHMYAKFPNYISGNIPYTFYSCPDHYTFRFNNVDKGTSYHYYINESGGGFRGYCTTSQTY